MSYLKKCVNSAWSGLEFNGIITAHTTMAIFALNRGRCNIFRIPGHCQLLSSGGGPRNPGLKWVMIPHYKVDLVQPKPTMASTNTNDDSRGMDGTIPTDPSSQYHGSGRVTDPVHRLIVETCGENSILAFCTF